MKKLNLCIDIDGTITEPYYWLNNTNDYFNLNITEKDVTCYNISKVLNVKEEAYLEFYEKYKNKIHNEQKLIPNIKEVLDKLSIDNNIYFVTARDKSLELLTFQYLKRHDIPFNDVFALGTHNKVPTAINLNCDIFIEDCYENALQLSQSGFKVLLIDTNYNRYDLNGNIIRVSNWEEILQIVNGLIKEKEAV